jgi:uncharacterized protein YcfJ
VGCSVGAVVGTTVGDAVGNDVGACEGSAVGARDGNAVGDAVVGCRDGAAVGETEQAGRYSAMHPTRCSSVVALMTHKSRQFSGQIVSRSEDTKLHGDAAYDTGGNSAAMRGQSPVDTIVVTAEQSRRRVMLAHPVGSG